YDFAAKKNVKTTATLRLMTDHAKWWAANDATVDLSGLRATATSFENKILPTDHRLYGEEWSPGIDGDPRINLVFARLPGAAAAHYGLAYMFLEFLRQQAGGEDFIRALMVKGIDTPADIDAVLKQRGQPGVEELYANFVAANAFIGATSDKQYSYPQGAPARQAANVVLGDTVAIGGIFRSTVHEYAVRYVELPRARMQLKF